MVKPWSFTEKGVQLSKADGSALSAHDYGMVKKREVEEFAAALDLERTAWSMLKQAAKNFIDGNAEYDGAYQRIKVLLVELDVSFKASVRAAIDVCAFFDPPIPTNALPDQAMLEFSVAALEQLKVRCIG